MSTRDLLFEIGTEELPPKALLRLQDALLDGVVDGLYKTGLAHGAVQGYATPRRLALLIEHLTISQPDRVQERRGPALTAAFNSNGQPTPAAQGFARSCGVTVDELERVETDKGAWLVHRAPLAGQPTQTLLPGIITAALDALPVPKRMRWGALRAEFVRPVHSLVLLFGEEVIDFELYGVRTGRYTHGHRFMCPRALYLANPRSYAPLLETEGRVLPEFAARREAIRAQVIEAAAALGGVAVIDTALLDEVTALVEWPVAISGSFDARFLSVPAEALISTMQGNQKYFHLVDAQGRLLPHFITVANIDSRDVSKVRAGNERVVRPRLSDAVFFWEQDRKQPLSAYLESLKTVVYQDKLGSVYDKAKRVGQLARMVIAKPDLYKMVDRAAELAKCDLMTRMVGEFPELQGVMGRYYAQHDGEPAEVAVAIAEHYQPRFAGDVLPRSTVGQALAVADRLDTLVGYFGIGQAPSGDKDPYGLRRAALGALRIMVECKLDLGGMDLLELLRRHAECIYSPSLPSDTHKQVHDFMMERLRGYYAEQDVTPDVFEAVLAVRPTQPLDFDRRVRAVTTFRALPEAASLAAANKRIRNILKQAEGAVPTTIDAQRFTEDAERELARAVTAMSATLVPVFAAGDYHTAMLQLAGLRVSVDAFFDTVMVMADDAAVRANRLALLNNLSALFLRVADISRLQG